MRHRGRGWQNTKDCSATGPNSSICDVPLAHRDNGFAEAPIDSIFVVSLNRDGYEEDGYLVNSAKMQPKSVIVRAYDTWRLHSAVACFVQSMRGGHYLSACATPPGDFMAANDAVLSGSMSIAEAWVSLNSEPILLIYTSDRPPGP